jgi:hypothetical protein
MEDKMALFGTKCSNCGQSLPAGARFCGNCGTVVGGGATRCGVCGAENRSDSKFCKNCGKPLVQSAAAEVISHRWTRGNNEFAVRVEADDLPGLLKRGIKVEPGTNAMLIYQGANQGTFPPGEYSLSSLGQRIKDWFTGDIPQQATILLVEVVPTDLEFHLGGRYTKDELPIGISIRLQAEVSEPAKFLVNLLKGGERFTQDDLRQYLYPEVTQVVDAWLRQHTLQELTEDLNLRPRLELALETRLKTTFSQSGLRFLQVRAAELNLEPYDHLKGVRGKFRLTIAETKANAAGEQELYDVETGIQISKAEAEAKAKARFAEIQRQVDLDELAQQRSKVALEEQKVDLYQRMRQAVLSDKMNEVRSENDFDRFLDEQDLEKLLREKDRADLKQTWAEEGEDQDRARAHLLARLDVERAYELRLIELKLKKDFDVQTLDSEIELARKRADFELEIRRKTVEEELRLEQERQRIAIEKEKAQIDLEQLQRRSQLATDREEATLGLEILAKMKDIRRLDEQEHLRIQREHELALARERQKLEIERWEAEERRLQATREHELKLRTLDQDFMLRRMEAAGKLGAEALISVSDVEQARILADLKKSESLKDLTEEQILAAAAADSPAVAQAFQEKYRAIASGEASQQTKDMYEKLLAVKEDAMRKLEEDARQHRQDLLDLHGRDMDNLKGVSEHAMDRVADTAQAFARGSGGSNQPVIVVPGGGGPQVIQPGATAQDAQPLPAGTKLCPKCGQFVPSKSRHCTHCGNKFEGVA